MSLYTPAAFACHDRAAMARLVVEHPFATLVTACRGAILASHLPLLLLPDREPYGSLIGHMARANLHWQSFASGKTVAIFQGPHHYVSPTWYEHSDGAVPTWNYAVAHCHGHPEIVEDALTVDAILDLTVRHFESHQPNPWTPRLTNEALAELRSAIVAFRIPIQSIEGKFKLSQNRKKADRQGVIRALDQSESQEARELARQMREYPG